MDRLDYCDFRELFNLVATVDPNRVYTTHGFTDELAGHLTTEAYDARALVEDQHTLGDSR
jgi:putative mRNA 3-end processing factor